MQRRTRIIIFNYLNHLAIDMNNKIGEYNPNPVLRAWKALWAAMTHQVRYWFYQDPNKVGFAVYSGGKTTMIVKPRTQFVVGCVGVALFVIGVLWGLRPAPVVETVAIVTTDTVFSKTEIHEQTAVDKQGNPVELITTTGDVHGDGGVAVFKSPVKELPDAKVVFKEVYDPHYISKSTAASGKLALGVAAKEAVKKGDAVSNSLSNVNSDALIAYAKREKYAKRFAPQAIEEMKQFGIPASITLAQGILESNAGESPLAREANNHFGIKCFSKTCKRGHCMNATDDSHKDFFRRYSSAFESFRGHSKFLKDGSRYADCFKLKRTDYKEWAMGLEHAGYATADKYGLHLIQLVQKHHLNKYDR